MAESAMAVPDPPAGARLAGAVGRFATAAAAGRGVVRGPADVGEDPPGRLAGPGLGGDTPARAGGGGRPGGASRAGFWTKTLLRELALVAGLVALAGPRFGTQYEDVVPKGSDLYVLI